MPDDELSRWEHWGLLSIVVFVVVAWLYLLAQMLRWVLPMFSLP